MRADVMSVVNSSEGRPTEAMVSSLSGETPTLLLVAWATAASISSAVQNRTDVHMVRGVAADMYRTVI